MNYYLSSGFFTPETRAKVEEVAKTIRNLPGNNIYVPMEDFIPGGEDMPNNIWAKVVFEKDVEEIDKCDKIIYLDFGANGDCGTANTDKDVVALIKGDFEFHGEGNNCGWYSSEYLTDCNVIATIVINETDSEIEYYLRKKKSHYDVLQIESLYQGCKFVADNDEYAIKMLWDMVCHAYDEGNSCWWNYINPSMN